MSLIVIKIGGDVFQTGQTGQAGQAGQTGQAGVLPAVARDVGAAVGRKERVVMIHGGGPQATALQRQLGQTPHIVSGRRVTDEATLDIMKMVVGGRLNIDLCTALLGAGVLPVGLHGASALAIEARRRPPRVISGAGPEPVDLGLVGDVVGINRDLFTLLLDQGYTPVVACLGADPGGQLLNINADVVANQVARALSADHLVLVTGTPGVLRDVDDPGSRIARMTVAEARAAIDDGTVQGGMIAKLDEAIEVVESGAVRTIHIIGRVQDGDLLRELDDPGALGTALVL